MKIMKFFYIGLIFFVMPGCSNKKKDNPPPVPPSDPNKTPDEISEEEREAELREETGNNIDNSENERNSDKQINREMLRINHKTVKPGRNKNTAILYSLDTQSLGKVKKQLSHCGKKHQLSVSIIVDPKGNVYLKPNQAFPADAFKCIQKNISAVKLNPGKFRKGVITLP